MKLKRWLCFTKQLLSFDLYSSLVCAIYFSKLTLLIQLPGCVNYSLVSNLLGCGFMVNNFLTISYIQDVSLLICMHSRTKNISDVNMSGMYHNPHSAPRVFDDSVKISTQLWPLNLLAIVFPTLRIPLILGVALVAFLQCLSFHAYLPFQVRYQ